MLIDVGLLVYYYVGFLGRRVKGENLGERVWGSCFWYEIIFDLLILNIVKFFYIISFYF